MISALASLAMVSGTPSWSLSSIAVAPISWRMKETVSFDAAISSAVLKIVRFAHQEVLLDLLVHLVQGLLSVDHGHLGVFVLPGPGRKLVRADVFVAQAQSPQGGIGKFLQHNKETVVAFTKKSTFLLGSLTLAMKDTGMTAEPGSEANRLDQPFNGHNPPRLDSSLTRPSATF